ncbi:PocR ligand-binding domain-containing protein [Pseudodesulfovibrio sp. zrk46]|uniref:PocR ligand-binding domain-containing protein n=1 Tax=Pseudodesulfovibrio sp. zrk46 TaxID=2725288 RepID=UPI00144915F8|nr:PocR ligand-binding domain-containing protein [Pseudodesulfovibrio sp. zrk46]QJB55479.1 transcriptional regulator [Pseudodesulfovibrio sp. zrk46]
MELTDFMPEEGWVALQNELHQRFNLNADVMNKEGKRLRDNTWGNDLCKAIREDAKGFGAICAPAGQMFLQLMQKGQKPFAEECDAGMMRVCVPVLKDGEFLGAVGGCGLVADEGEVDGFTIEMMSDLDAELITQAAKGVSVASEDRVQEIQDFIQERVAEALA